MTKSLVTKQNYKKEILITLAILAGYILVPFFVYISYFISGNVMLTGDGISYLNMRNIFASGFTEGDPALWNKFAMLGTPFMADLQNSFFYPLSYLSLLMPINIFSNVLYVASLTIAGFSMYLFMKELQQNRVAAIVTGFVFMFATIIGGARSTHSSIYSTIIWLPLVLFFIQRYVRTNKRSELIFASIVMAIQFFAGFPQTMVYSSIFVFLYLIVFMDKSKQFIKKRIIDILIWLGIFAALIAIQLIPQLELIKDSGRASISFEFFAMLSSGYKILPMIFFPTLFKEINMPFGVNHSTGIDIEIYMGLIVAVFLIYAIIFHLKDKKIRWFAIFAILGLLYCMIGNIPFLSYMVWKTPILGSFRVASRMLFIFIFFAIVIFGIILAKIKERQEAKRLLKFSLVMFAVIIFTVLIVKSIAATAMANDVMKEYYAGLSVFVPTIVVSLCLIGSLAAYCYVKYFYTKKHAFAVLAIVLCIITLVDVGRFSTKHSSVDYNEHMKNGKSGEIDFIKEQNNSEKFRTIAAITTTDHYINEKSEAYTLNGATAYKFNAYNSYITFESKNVNEFMNLQGSLIMPSLNNVMLNSNEKISATSIKYIADLYKILSKEDFTGGMGKEIFAMQNILMPSNNGEISIVSYEIALEPNKTYYIEVEGVTMQNSELFFVDFYGKNYDLPESEVAFDINKEQKKYIGAVTTGDVVLPSEVYLRCVSKSDSDIQISNLKVYEAEMVPFDLVYKTLVDNEEMLIYENVNAKPVINIANSVQDMAEYIETKVNEVSFVQNAPKELHNIGNKATAELIEWKNNSIKAKIVAQEEVFVNHTQAMYSGWNAYVDGVKVENYMVNGVVQGTYVPQGEHILEFKFESMSLYIGIIITIIGIGLCIFIVIREKKK